MARRLASIARAARTALPEVIVLPGLSGHIVLASRRPLVMDPRVSVERLEARAVEARLVGAPYLEYVYTNDRVSELARIVDTEDVPVNSDVEPVCYQYTVLDWLSKFLPAAALVDVVSVLRDTTQSTASEAWIFGSLAVIFLAGRLRAGLRRALLAAMAGFTGMILETVLLLQYQVKNGILYQDIGVLLTMFMLGLAAGSASLEAFGRRAARGTGSRRSWGLALLAAFAGLSAGTSAGIAGGGITSLLEVSVGLFFAGFLVAALFAHASLHRLADQTAAVSPLYAADLAGGSIAAVAGSLVTIPALGLGTTLEGTALVALLGVLLL
jgi:hypothetical protein